MWDLMLHIDSYDKSICRTVRIGHVPESKEKFYKNNLYRAFKGFVILRRTLSILGRLLSYARSTVCEFSIFKLLCRFLGNVGLWK